MNLERVKYFRPTINLSASKGGSFQFALYAHILTFIASCIIILFSFLSLGDDVVWAIILVGLGLGVLVIELDLYSFPELKQAEIRGIIWIAVGILGIQTTILGGMLLLVAGTLDLLYYNGY